MDVLTPEQRQLNMSRIRGQNTKPELLLRRGLHGLGLRFRLHVRKLPGRPDIVFPRHHAAIFVHGCFWHGHHCPMFKLPTTRRQFWTDKIAANRDRDLRAAEELRKRGWRILSVWECSLRGPVRRPLTDVIAQCARFVRGSEEEAEITGAWPSRSGAHA